MDVKRVKIGIDILLTAALLLLMPYDLRPPIITTLCLVGFDPEGKPRMSTSGAPDPRAASRETRTAVRGVQLPLEGNRQPAVSVRGAHRYALLYLPAQEGWRQHSYAASCGVSDLVMWQMLKDNPQIDTVFLCRMEM